MPATGPTIVTEEAKKYAPSIVCISVGGPFTEAQQGLHTGRQAALRLNNVPFPVPTAGASGLGEG